MTEFEKYSRGKNGEYYVVAKQRKAHEVYKVELPMIMGTRVVCDSRSIPIGTYCGPSPEREYDGKKIPTMFTEEFFDLFADMGIDFFASTVDYSTDEENTKKFMELCGEYGMGVFLTVSKLRGTEEAKNMTEEKIMSNLKEMASNGNVLGFELRDEPDVEMLKKLKKTVDVFNKSVYGENHILYYNAFPNYSTPEQLSGTKEGISYEEYLREYVKYLSAKYLSFDYYPFDKDGNASSGYFENLSTVRQIADENKIPFWTFVQCGAIFSIEFTKRYPDRSRFFWNVSTGLAYGSKGIQYFTLSGQESFLSRVLEKGERESIEGIIGVDNRINDWYYYAKEINAHIKKIDAILVNSYNEGVIFHGESPCKISSGNEIIKDGKYRELQEIKGGDCIVGCFDYKGKTALYVVNNNFSKSQAISLLFGDNYGYDIIQETSQTFKSGKVLNIEAEAGEGVLVVIK